MLIIETSTEKALIAFGEECHFLEGGPTLSKNLSLEVKNLLKGCIPDAIAVGTGPGSYTGIRVGVALAKALAFAWDIPLFGFCSLKAFGPAPVLVDARSGGFYALLGEFPELIQPLDPRLQEIPSLSTPHPELIKKRLISPALLQEKNPSPKLCLDAVFEEKNRPFELHYLSSP